MTRSKLRAEMLRRSRSSVERTSGLINDSGYIDHVDHLVTSVNGATGDVTVVIPIVVPQEKSDWNSVSGNSQILNKPTIPVVKRTETHLGTTNASGDYKVVYPSPYSTTPDVQPQLQAGTPSQVVRVTASTTAGFTVNVTNRATTSVLGIDLISATATPVSGASVGVLVTER